MKKNHDNESQKKENAAEPKQESGHPPQEAKPPEDLQDKLLRLKADFENTKKRLERDKQAAIQFANEKLLAEILSIVDNFDRAMASLSEGHDPEQVKKGLQIAQEELHEVLESHGVQVVKSVGEVFDPQFHEAVGVVEAAGDMKEGQIVDEIQRGYVLNGRLLRPSRVRIAQHGEDKTENAEDEEEKTEDRGQNSEKGK